MKKLLFIVTAMLLIGVTSCNKETKCEKLQYKQNYIEVYGESAGKDEVEYNNISNEMFATGCPSTDDYENLGL